MAHRHHRLDRAITRTLLAAGLLAPARVWGIPAFSGADGAGSATTGGRGGSVYHVTRLDTSYSDTGPGTFQFGLNDANFTVAGVVQPRTIVFDVGGSIWFGRNPTDTEGWDSNDRRSVGSKITIAGQTAPGGINLMAGTLKVNGNQAIIRNLTIAAGYGTSGIGADGIPDSYVYDAMNIHADNVIVDHVSAVFATDEAISADEFANHTTLQFNNISQGQNYPNLDTNGQYTGHAFGSLWQPGTGARTTIHHNLYAQQKGRLPRVGSSVGTGAINDFRNNVIYNWLGTAGTGASNQPSYNNFVSNLFLSGPGGENPVGGTTTAMTTAPGGTTLFNGNDAVNTRVYHAGNLKDINKDGDANDGVVVTDADFGASTFVGSPYDGGYTGVTDSAGAAYARVLDYMGANWTNRSAIDARLVNETRTGTGQITAWNDPTHGTEWNSLLALRSASNGGAGATGAFTRPANWDTDQDGMPDTWEAAHGLSPAIADNNGDFDSDGYTNLEEYINEIAEWPAPQPIIFTGGAGGRYALITNWDIQWQPSKYDVARINSGSAVVDSVGQHAGTLQVAAGGSAAALSVIGGWIEIATALQIGVSGNGVLQQSGGIISAPVTTISASGSINQTGGLANLGAVSGAGSASISGGTMQVSSIRLANLSVSGSGGVQIAPDGSPTGTSKIAVLSISGGAVDLTNNQLIVGGNSTGTWDGSAYTGVTGLIASGRNGAPAAGNWGGSGIITSQSDATSGNLTSLGVAQASQVLGISATATAVWHGQTVGGSDALVMYTYGGDANLDGKLNVDDYTRIDFNVPLGTTGWYNGDFNYDGKINVDDYTIIDFNIGIQGAPLGGFAEQATLSAVPEPGALGFLGIGALAIRRRRRS